MIRIAKINLDIRKDAVVNNEPIILRQGESDVTIEATVLNGGDENLQINFATFVAKKPDGTIVSNDPTNVNGSVISYSVSKHLTESVGKIQDAYFMINNEVTTNGFDISVIPSTQLDDTSVSYIPGIENISKFLTDTENDWLGRIQQMKSQIAGLSIPDEFKLLMDKALSDAKAQYQPIIDAAEKNVESIAADLAAKKLDLQNNSDELNTTIASIKAQIAPVNSFLDNIQKQIIDANASFTADQQAKVSQSISDLKARLDALGVLKIGGANLLTGTKKCDFPFFNIGGTQTVQKYDDETNYIQNTSDTPTKVGPWLPWTLELGQVYTLSADVCGNGYISGNLFRYEGDDNGNLGRVDLTDDWQRISNTFRVTKIDGALVFYANNSTLLKIKNIKIEKGSVATDWCPNPSEILTKGDTLIKVVTQAEYDALADKTGLYVIQG